jgi:hypothetical protein
MPTEIWVAVLTLVGTMTGTFGGILVSNKLTCYRIEQLEKKVDEHNNFARRMPLVEQRIEFLEKEIEAR